jgi:hypothetical protein
VTGYSAVIRRYVDERVTVIVLANADEGGGFAVDAMSKAIADMYVPGVAFPSLTPNTDPEAGAIERWRGVLTSVANGLEHPDAPGLAQRLPAPVRARLGAALGTGTPAAAKLEFLGEERVTDRHFNLDPAVVALRHIARRRQPPSAISRCGCRRQASCSVSSSRTEGRGTQRPTADVRRSFPACPRLCEASGGAARTVLQPAA